MADSVETLGVDLRTRVENLGAREKARREKCKVRFLLMQDRRREVFTSGYSASKNVGSTCSEDGSSRKMNIEDAHGSSSGQNKSATSSSLFMEAFGLGVEEELSSMATQTWAEGAWVGKWHTEQ